VASARPGVSALPELYCWIYASLSCDRFKVPIRPINLNGMANTRRLSLLAGLGLIALLASGAGKDAPKDVASLTPEIVTLSPRASQAMRPPRTAPGRRPASTFDDNDRGVLLLLLLSAQPPR